jgi:hypothetical protein
MSAKNFAEEVLKGRDEAEIREAVGKERQWTAKAAELELRAKDGHVCEACSWALLRRWRWQAVDDAETLVLLFAGAAVRIEGRNLERLTEMIREERLEFVQEHDASEAALLDAQNASLERKHRRAVITRLAVLPPFAAAARDILEGRES